MKPRQNNNMIVCIDAFYIKNDIELLWPIKPGLVCDEY